MWFNQRGRGLALCVCILVLAGCTPKWRSVNADKPVGHLEVTDSATAKRLGKVASKLGVVLSDLPFAGIQLRLPKDWVSAPVTGQRILLTRDGLTLQQIGVRVYNADEAFGGRRKDTLTRLNPLELMELQMADLRGFNPYPVIQTTREVKREGGAFPIADSLPDASTAVKISAGPTTVDGKPAFELVTASYNVLGTEFMMKTVGLIHGGHYWVFHYQAPSLYFYAATLTVFDEFLATAHLGG